eukprot:2877126-Rhodomonas_salina.1
MLRRRNGTGHRAHSHDTSHRTQLAHPTHNTSHGNTSHWTGHRAQSHDTSHWTQLAHPTHNTSHGTQLVHPNHNTSHGLQRAQPVGRRHISLLLLQ